MLRLFIGIKTEPLPLLLTIRSDLKKVLQASQVNWVDPSNYHITLKFLGDVEPYYINSINQLIKHLALKIRSFTLQYNEVGIFGTKKQPRVIWFGFKDQDTIHELQASIENSLTDLGFMAEEKTFHPHLTLARIKNIQDTKPLMNYIELNNPKIEGEITIKEFQLFQSVLQPEGPVYSIVQQFRLT